MAADLSVTELDANTLALVGELDTHTAHQLSDRLDEVGDATPLVLDLSGVSFISSAGLSVILNVQRRLRGAGGALTLRSPTPAVDRLVQLSGLSETLDFS